MEAEQEEAAQRILALNGPLDPLLEAVHPNP